MFVFGGFFGGNIGKYSNSIYSLDLKKLGWTELKVSTKLMPALRANSAMASQEGSLVVFGGGDLNFKYNDLWKFNLAELQWEKLPSQPELAPESRNGHSLTSFNDLLVLFGGIHDITH